MTAGKTAGLVWVLGLGTLATGCQLAPRTFQDDVDLMKRHTEVIVLADGASHVAVCPGLQGRVMTSTVAGPKGAGLGYVNHDMIAKQNSGSQFNNYGGEDRFWLGPEGGQFSLFFMPGRAQTVDNWLVPAALDRDAFDVVAKTDTSVKMARRLSLVNYSRTPLEFRVEREVKLVGRDQAGELLGLTLPAGVAYAGYLTHNVLTNLSRKPVTRAGGLVSIWIPGMFKPSSECVAIVPYNRRGSGPIAMDDYFGKVPANRLKTDPKAGVVLFLCDGRHRSKIGVGRARATDRIASMDYANKLLTIVTFNLPAGAPDYVNSHWKTVQEDPFTGDVVNSYNDGPARGGVPAKPTFYELETSSPAQALAAGESITHIHRTLHFHGSIDALERVAAQALGVSLRDVYKTMVGRAKRTAAMEDYRIPPVRRQTGSGSRTPSPF